MVFFLHTAFLCDHSISPQGRANSPRIWGELGQMVDCWENYYISFVYWPICLKSGWEREYTARYSFIQYCFWFNDLHGSYGQISENFRKSCQLTPAYPMYCLHLHFGFCRRCLALPCLHTHQWLLCSEVCCMQQSQAIDK